MKIGCRETINFFCDYPNTNNQVVTKTFNIIYNVHFCAFGYKIIGIVMVFKEICTVFALSFPKR